jgi:hypothetical protein
MAKTLKASSRKNVAKDSPGATKVVRNAKTGQPVTVKGVGALKGNNFKIKKGVSLLKPIAKQALIERSEKRRAG